MSKRLIITLPAKLTGPQIAKAYDIIEQNDYMAPLEISGQVSSFEDAYCAYRFNAELDYGHTAELPIELAERTARELIATGTEGKEAFKIVKDMIDGAINQAKGRGSRHRS